jgi:hypothetical protein
MLSTEPQSLAIDLSIIPTKAGESSTTFTIGVMKLVATGTFIIMETAGYTVAAIGVVQDVLATRVEFHTTGEPPYADQSEFSPV